MSREIAKWNFKTSSMLSEIVANAISGVVIYPVISESGEMFFVPLMPENYLSDDGKISYAVEWENGKLCLEVGFISEESDKARENFKMRLEVDLPFKPPSA